jgi:hypothetical protein
MRSALLAFVLFGLGCTGEMQPVGLGEPIRVRSGRFRLGALPGSEDPESPGPGVTSLDLSSTIVTIGQLDRFLAGRVTEDAVAIGVGFVDLGTGWWVTPVEGLDGAFPGERFFSFDYDVGGGIPAGLHRLRLAAIDEAGLAGPFRELEFCVVDDTVPDNLRACDPSATPPAAVITLTWDEPVDLDLVVDTPEGKRVDHRSPTTALSEDGDPIPREVLMDPSVGRLSRNSNAECVLDARNAESLVFAEDPAPGTYLVYANLFEACGRPSATFVVTVYRREPDGEGGSRLVLTDRRSGVVLGLSANGGAGPPLYVTAVSFP